MSASFVDTNVVVYLAQRDLEKGERAEALILSSPYISVQVINEFAQVARRKMRWDWPEIIEFIAYLTSLTRVQPLSVEISDLGLRLAQRCQLHIYDAMIIAAALEAGCDILYSEDMQPGLRIQDRLTIVDPFV
jgi:predicted nucleic acid-binding protein